MRRLMRLLLYVFPAQFRRRFGFDMLADFDDRWRERPGWRLGIRTALDLAAAGAAERFSRRSHPIERRRGDRLMTILWQDLRFAARMLMRSRGFAVVSLAMLALGIGVNTAMFSVAHAVLWRSMPYPDPERVVMVGEVDRQDPSSYWGASYPNLRDWRARSRSFEHLAGVMYDRSVLREGQTPVVVAGSLVSHEFFDVMGVAPQLGRVFGESEDRKGAPGVIVLSHRMWMERLGGDSAVLGRTIRFGRNAYTIIGVMPAGYEYRQAEYWIPLEQDIDPGFVTHRDVWVLSAVGRLRNGVTPGEAQKEVEGIASQIRHDYPETRRGQVIRAAPLRDELSRDLRPALLVLLGAVGFVLLIVCGNLAGLMLARGTARAREMAIRSALGVGWARLMRQLLTESALLAGAGGAAGIGLAYWATRSIGLLTKDPRLANVPLDGAVLGFAAAVTASTTILFGIAPAIRATLVGAAEALKSGSRAGFAPERAVAQRALVVCEVALCLALLSGAGLLWKSFQRVFEVNPGFQTDRLVALRVGLPLSYDSDDMVKRFYLQLEERLSRLPGVIGATIVSQLPISGGEGNGDIAIEGRAAAAGELGASTFRHVMPNYFSVMGIRLMQGRVFDQRDDGSAGRVAIINEGFARRFWPDGDAIGKRFKVGPRDRAPWLTIVGVVGDVRQIRLDSAAPFSTYEPLAVGPEGRFEVALRAAGDPASVIASARAELRALEPALLVDNVGTMSQRIGESVSARRLNLILFELFAGLALLLAGIGLYGVVAYTAAQRTQEFGIRMALGAQSRDVGRLVLGQALRLAMVGIGVGLVVTLNLARLMKGLLFGVAPTDPETLAAVAALLAVVAIAACWIPAYRATRVAPVEALRSE